MTHSFKLSRRIARLRAALLATVVLSVLACNSTDSFDPASNSSPAAVDQGPEAGVQVSPVGQPQLASTSFAGGIPFGMFALPTSEFGARYNGARNNIWPNHLLDELAAIKGRGGKIILMMAGPQAYYKNADGTFSLSKWKARIDRFKTVNFSAYVSDGTVIGHYLIDEPNDPTNWGGKPISPATVEEMAKYSKQLWPNLVTIARVAPAYLTGSHPYLDAAWAQYVSRKGDVNDYIKRNVADAQSRGLALVVGLNVLKGGTPNGTKMTASEVKSWGSALLSSSYPCAFLSWTYDDGYLSSSDIRSAMDALRDQAESRSSKTCRGP